VILNEQLCFEQTISKRPQFLSDLICFIFLLLGYFLLFHTFHLKVGQYSSSY
jgi:hypothetical protein